MSKEKKEEFSKEIKEVRKAISNWSKKHGGNVCIICSLVAFEGKDGLDVIDDWLAVSGTKETLEVQMEEFAKQVAKTKEMKELI